jgi:hypothetical protein
MKEESGKPYFILRHNQCLDNSSEFVDGVHREQFYILQMLD